MRTVRCHLNTPVAFTTFTNVWTRNLLKNNMVEDCARMQRKMRELRSTLTTVETIFARNQFPGAGMITNLLLSVLTIYPTTFGLAILLDATLATVEDFPSVENATMSSFVTMTKKMLKKIASANLG